MAETSRRERLMLEVAECTRAGLQAEPDAFQRKFDAMFQEFVRRIRTEQPGIHASLEARRLVGMR